MQMRSQLKSREILQINFEEQKAKNNDADKEKDAANIVETYSNIHQERTYNEDVEGICI